MAPLVPPVAGAAAVFDAPTDGDEIMVARDRHPQVQFVSKVMTPSAKKRKFSKDAFAEIEVEQRTCIKGGRLNEWACLPNIELDGVTLCRFGCSKEPWINMLLAGRALSPEISSAIGSVKEQLRKSMETHSPEEQDKTEEDAMRLARAGRDALNLGEFSDSEDGEDDDDEVDKQSRGDSVGSAVRCQRRGAVVIAGKVREFEFRGMSMKAVSVSM